MRTAAVALSLILLTGCRASPNIERVTADSKTQLQHELTKNYAEKNATVQKVSLVLTTAPKYEGEATIAFDNSTFTVPLAVTSDGLTTLVTTDDQKLASGFELILQRDLANLEGKYSDYILNPAMFDRMPASLAKADFVARLSVVALIKSDDHYYFGSGCAQHECGMNETAWVIDKTTGKGAALIMKYKPDDPGLSEADQRAQHTAEVAHSLVTQDATEAKALASHNYFQLYGAALDNLPPPLAAWADQHGMTKMNVGSDVPPAYQAPQK
jgi:hypothetical protein